MRKFVVDTHDVTKDKTRVEKQDIENAADKVYTAVNCETRSSGFKQ